MSYDGLLVHHGAAYRQAMTYEEGTPVPGPWSEVAAFPCRLAPSSEREVLYARTDQRGYDERATLFVKNDVALKRTDRIQVEEFPDKLWEVSGVGDRWEYAAFHHVEVQLGRITGT